MTTLPAPLRRQLERAAQDARNVAEAGARKALEALAVHEPDPYRHMDEAQRTHRRQLRAQAKQLGDGESQTRRGAYEIKHLVEKLAYDQWHRLLFARFLLENNLLISPEHGVSVSLDDCVELAPSLGLKDAWAVAARFAAVELPEIFRADDPAGGVELPVEDRKGLIQLVTGLPVEVFTASDSLGWCYQFWQTQRKEDVNKAGNKIGADELPSVTQLFTEDYMVDFLLDNTLGAWWAGKKLTAENAKNAERETRNRRSADIPVRSVAESSRADRNVRAPMPLGIHAQLANNFDYCSTEFQSEDEVRLFCALPGCPWKYLRFIRTDAANVSPSLPAEGGEGRGEVGSSQPSTLNSQPRWTPAAGTFSGWPKTAKELKCLDPCMGSGHFEVAMFERLVALRLAEEKLDEAAAVAAVIRDNLFGLEIDPRCTQIAAFNLALAAWRRVGHCKLPAMNIACSGLGVNARKEDWLAVANGDSRLRTGLEQLYDLFQKAPELGSLINPRQLSHGDLVTASFAEIQPLLAKALQTERARKNDELNEIGVAAQGMARAANLLAEKCHLVVTNVPYLARGKHGDILMEFAERYAADAKTDLATLFVRRCLNFCAEGGSTALVTPQNWLFLTSYTKLRKCLLGELTWNHAAWLGSGAFETISGEVVKAALLTLTASRPQPDHEMGVCDVSDLVSITEKIESLRSATITLIPQSRQKDNPDSRIVFSKLNTLPLLSSVAESYHGLCCFDSPRFVILFWEIPNLTDGWVPQQSSPPQTQHYGGCNYLFLWEHGNGGLARLMETKKEHGYTTGVWRAGVSQWGRKGVLVAPMGDIPCALYLGCAFDDNTSVIFPRNPSHLAALWTFCMSLEFSEALRKIDHSLKITCKTLIKVPFNVEHWQKVAAEKYPHGLPKPFSSDPTQWLFNGHPGGADQPLHVAVARLLGYQWPRQTGSSFPDCPALAPDGLETLADDDGIVPISPAKGEGPAAERLRELLARAYGKDWSSTQQEELLASLNPQPATLEDWLRNGFFEQHCALFHHRPFIWHVWDGLKNGFSALVNYHKLTHANLEKLTFAYLGDWIRRQQAAVAAEEAGSDAKLQAAKQLQATLKLILEGEPPYDLFVRWKPLAQQSIGWHPDLNDGVRMNIRPFTTADILRKRVKIKWDKDRGKEPQRDKAEYPWFWGWDEAKQDFAGGREFTGDRWNDCHYTGEFKQKARK